MAQVLKKKTRLLFRETGVGEASFPGGLYSDLTLAPDLGWFRQWSVEFIGFLSEGIDGLGLYLYL